MTTKAVERQLANKKHRIQEKKFIISYEHVSYKVNNDFDFVCTNSH